VAIRSYKDLVDAEENGQTFIGGFRKTVVAQTGQNAWFDITLSPGNPLPFYYASSPVRQWRHSTQSSSRSVWV
jgi:hypothetical protein